MEVLLTQVTSDIDAVVDEWIRNGHIQAGDLFVIGCSTSEVAGSHIGTAGSDQIAARLFSSLHRLEKRTGIHLVFQCCEHLNRALVVDQKTKNEHPLTEVAVIPHRDAGGAMATFAYGQFDRPVVVEEVEAQAGIDIGETMIGMHLQPVVVPLRMNQSHIASARITGAYTRPKLIGGQRARYE